MQAAELRAALQTLNLNQCQLADLLGVTRRAVQYWVSSERAVPGPVAAYVCLLQQVQEEARQRANTFYVVHSNGSVTLRKVPG